MKKLIVLSAIGMFAFASCKKDYTCTCTTKNSDTSFISLEFEADHKLSERNESKAQETCDGKAAQQNAEYGEGYTTTCGDVKEI